MVGSIVWTAKVGERVEKGEEMMYFQFGGSTVILVCPQGTIRWDEDLLRASESDTPVETLVKVGERVGSWS